MSPESEDDRFARAAVDYGLMSDEEVSACRARVGESHVPLAQAARELAILSPYQIASIHQLMANPDAISPVAPEDVPAAPPVRRARRKTVEMRAALPTEVYPGDYVAVEWLGIGPHGRVILAENRASALRRAVKLVAVDPNHPGLAAFTSLRSRLATLEHAGLQRIFDTTVAGGMLVLSSQAVEGLSALQMSERVPITVERACQFVIEAGRSLEVALLHGLYHGNLKAENLLISKTQEVVLADFGALWKLVERPAEHEPTACPFRCLAPEVLAGDGPSVASEVYGLAAVLYELATRSPIYAGTCDEVRHAIAKGLPTAPSQRNPRVPPVLETILLTALERKPDDRYASPRELAYDLNAFLHGSPIAARRLGLMARLRSLFGGRAN